MCEFTVEDLKVLKRAISRMPLDKQVMDTIEKVDYELAKHGLRAVWVSAPKLKYQRQALGEYQFENIKL
jgi:hypothetical protein